MKKLLILTTALSLLLLGACERRQNAADVASKNLSTAADNFEIPRNIVFYNGITGSYMLQIEGLCSLENNGRRLAVTCMTGKDSYTKHFLGLSDNVSYFSEQLEGVDVSTYHYRRVFAPQSVLPDWDLRVDGEALKKAVTPDNKD